MPQPVDDDRIDQNAAVGKRTAQSADRTGGSLEQGFVLVEMDAVEASTSAGSSGVAEVDEEDLFADSADDEDPPPVDDSDSTKEDAVDAACAVAAVEAVDGVSVNDAASFDGGDEDLTATIDTTTSPPLTHAQPIHQGSAVHRAPTNVCKDAGGAPPGPSWPPRNEILGQEEYGPRAQAGTKMYAEGSADPPPPSYAATIQAKGGQLNKMQTR